MHNVEVPIVGSRPSRLVQLKKARQELQNGFDMQAREIDVLISHYEVHGE